MEAPTVSDDVRPGEIRAALDPAALPPDAGIVFIGCARTPWRDRGQCPKNMRQARERGEGARLEIAAPWRAGLAGLAAHPHAIVLTWMDRARRDLVVQAPRHSATPSGVFALRSPVRPNPIGVHVVRILALDAAAGIVEVDALDCLDLTPLVDLKPWLASVDIPPDPPLAPAD
jgi:tRNA-Thr(GGU) m(6)t(6)A37 methyltransferase TsaA